MKSKDVKIAALYLVKVSKVVVTVKIIRENPRGGWDALNLSTGRKILIRGPQRIRKEVERYPNGGK
jgi:hypothetical protein